MFTPIHFLFGIIIGFLLACTGYISDTGGLIIFVIGSIIMDIDHLITISVMRGEPYDSARRLLLQCKFKELGVFIKEHHKEFNKLILHNYSFFLVLFALFLLIGSLKLRVLLLAMITHCVMDHFDDVYVEGHLRNWFWFLRSQGRMLFAIIFSVFVIFVVYYVFLFYSSIYLVRL